METTKTTSPEVSYRSQTHVGSDITVGGSVGVNAGGPADTSGSHDIIIIGSKVDTKEKAARSASDKITRAEARDISEFEAHSSSKKLFGKKASYSRTETSPLSNDLRQVCL
ncbi:hemagglutinin repeat-containing protein [Brucella sp. BE17]|uniref:hemagglutinin repeat-containing protein n=1 Tax=Brucella sp. BE17 TaxID=3142977 RepID=UPI0031BA3C2C